MASFFNIHDYLRERQSLIDRALDRYLKELRQPQTLYRAMHHGVFSGGKRLRPILTLAAGELFGGRHRLLLPFACAIELIHTYSLIHDDLPALDNDDMRRGKLASHKIFGEGMALLAGDALLTEAFHLMTRPQVVRALDPSLVLELVREIAGAAGVCGMVGGQAVDLEAEGCEANVEMVEQIHERKTGALILTAARVGARIGGAKPGEMRRISRYAEFLGLAFQIADDILDSEDHNDANGAAHAGDRKKKKATYPSIVGLAKAKSRAHELLRRCLKEMELFDKEAEPLRGIAHYIVKRAA